MRRKALRPLVFFATIFLLLTTFSGAARAQEGGLMAEDGVVVAEGLNGPQGVLVDEDGNVWVIDSGVGGTDEVPFFNTQSMEEIVAMGGESAQVAVISADGQEVYANLPSLLMGMEALGGGRLALLDGVLYATVGQGAGDPEWEGAPDFGGVVSVDEAGVSMLASTWDFERANNPDGTALFDSHPYGLTAGPDGYLYVADSGANDVLKIDPETGEASLFAVLEPLPGVFPSATRGGEMLADPVPTAIVFDDDGNAYVSNLSGAPFIPGSAGVVMIAPGGEVSQYATGYTMLMDLRWGPDGELYGVQFGMFAEDGPVPDAGSVVRIHGGEAYDVVIDGLSFPTSLDFNEAGDAYVSFNGLGAPGSGAVAMFAGLAAGAMETEDDHDQHCENVSHADLTEALQAVVGAGDNGGFGFNMWATIVDRDGEVCAVTMSGDHFGDQFPASRVISAQKANTANAFSLPGIALSSANLFTAVQPGNSLYGLQFSNPVDSAVAYAGEAEHFGQEDDPMVGFRIGGVNVFGGGLALYDHEGHLLGGLGLSGDTACTDHIIAWKVRDMLGLDHVPGGVSETGDDNVVYDAQSGWSHPECGMGEVEIAAALPVDYPLGDDKE